MATDTPNTQPKAKIAPDLWYVVDKTAGADGKRTHEQIVDGRIQPFTFEGARPLEMSKAIAIKFLRDPAFVLTNKDGNAIPYERTPRQPDDLGAGEKLALKDNETVARYDELSTAALVHRVSLLVGGEKFSKSAEKPDRAEMITFIIAAKVALRKANTSKGADIGKDDFVPQGEFDEDREADAA